MAEKILAFLVAFASGAAFISLIGAKLINLAIRHSPRTRKMVRDTLDREDARHAITGQRLHPMAESFEAGMQSAADEGLCELYYPIDKSHIDERWRRCPNEATRQMLVGSRTLNVCEEHFKKGAS